MTLVDGRQVSNYSEEYRLECEARAVCRMPHRLARNQYMDKVRARRGQAAHDTLWRAVLQVWDAEFRKK